MVISDSNELQIQSRFSGLNSRGTVTKGIALSQNSGTVQVSISENSDTISEQMNGCPITVFVNGVLQKLGDDTGLPTIIIDYVSPRGEISLLTSTNIRVSFRPIEGTFGCYLEFMRTFIPDVIIQNGGVRGLLGTPNGDAFDDWTTKTGEIITVPKTRQGRLFEEAYTYCTSNWCVSEESESLFSYESGTSFESFNLCNLPYGTTPDFDSVSSEVRELCRNADACLVDGLSGNLDDAWTALNVQAEQKQLIMQQSSLQFIPSVIQVGTIVNIKITIDVSSPRTNENINSFSVFRLDTNTGQIQRNSIATLRDDGSALSSDEVAGDFIFFIVLPSRSDIAGDVFSFRVIPIIDGSDNSNYALVTTAQNSIRSYSVSSGLGKTTERSSTEITISSLDGLELVAIYSWSFENRDLDTPTRFLDGNVGYSCAGSNQYLQFGGDRNPARATETVVINLFLFQALVVA